MAPSISIHTSNQNFCVKRAPRFKKRRRFESWRCLAPVSVSIQQFDVWQEWEFGWRTNYHGLRRQWPWMAQCSRYCTVWSATRLLQKISIYAKWKKLVALIFTVPNQLCQCNRWWMTIVPRWWFCHIFVRLAGGPLQIQWSMHSQTLETLTCAKPSVTHIIFNACADYTTNLQKKNGELYSGQLQLYYNLALYGDVVDPGLSYKEYRDLPLPLRIRTRWSRSKYFWCVHVHPSLISITLVFSWLTRKTTKYHIMELLLCFTCGMSIKRIQTEILYI